MKYTNSNQWYQEYGFKIMSDYEFMDFEKYLDDIRQNGSHTLDEWENLYDDFLTKESKKLYFYNDIGATNSIRISNSEIAELDLVAKINESDLDKYLKKYLKKDTNIWFYYDLSDLAEDYDCQYVQNDEFGLWYTDENIVESKKSSRKSIKESKDSYKVKVLNEMLDAMAKDEYNIPKVGIYGVTKNINLDIGAIQLLIDYYK
jgi:hypothetical protein